MIVDILWSYMKTEPIITMSDTPIWNLFSLSYASYAVFPRVALCSMPIEWQERFCQLVHEMNDAMPDEIMNRNYQIRVRNSDGKYEFDPLSNYRHHPMIKLKGKYA